MAQVIQYMVTVQLSSMNWGYVVLKGQMVTYTKQF
jgi:hypothetical protein